jgi:hypothetical protein
MELKAFNLVKEYRHGVIRKCTRDKLLGIGTGYLPSEKNQLFLSVNHWFRIESMENIAKF